MNQIRKQKLIIIAIMFTAATVAVAFVLVALSQNINAFYTPSQIAQGQMPIDKQFRAGGMVVEDSVIRTQSDLNVRFALTDFESQVEVVFSGILPDLFREGQGIVVTGVLNKQGVLVASEVLAKHDENYAPPAVTEALKEAKSSK